MASAIEDVIRRCTDPLREDWTLQQEVAQELRSHLEEKCAELEHIRGCLRKSASYVPCAVSGSRMRSALDCFAPIFTG